MEPPWSLIPMGQGQGQDRDIPLDRRSKPKNEIRAIALYPAFPHSLPVPLPFPLWVPGTGMSPEGSPHP